MSSQIFVNALSADYLQGNRLDAANPEAGQALVWSEVNQAWMASTITGPPGPSGAVGPAGPMGPMGLTGNVGPQGRQGMPGYQIQSFLTVAPLQLHQPTGTISLDTTGIMQASNNFSELADPTVARQNLGLGTAATMASSAFVAPTGAVSSLKAMTAPAGYARLAGYGTVGDGGGGLFRWDSTDTTSADNGGTVLASTSGASGRWKRVYEGWVNARWFGVNPSSADNTQALQNAINYVGSLAATGTEGGTVFIPFGYYRFAFTAGASGLSTISIPYDNVHIVGEGRGTVLTVRSPSTQVGYFFTWSLPGQRGEGGGIRDITISGNSQLQWGNFLDSWRYWEMSNVQHVDVFSGSLDACNNQTSYGENITVRHCDQKASSGTNSCFSQYFIRFRAGSVGSWTECSIRDCLALGVWDTAYLIDGCQRFTLDQVAGANNAQSSNTIDGRTRAGLLTCVKLTNSVVNTSTTDTGYHVVRAVYHESHYGTESYTTNTGVWIDTPTGQTGLNRYNQIEKVAVKSGLGTAGMGSVCVFKVTNTASSLVSYTASNRFRDCRGSVSNSGVIQIGAQASETMLDLAASSAQLWKVQDYGNRTIINGAGSATWGANYPNNTPGLGKVDVGQITRDTVTGRVAWQDRNNVPVLIGPRPGKDVVSPYGAQRITSLATASAPTITPAVTGSTTWTYHVVAIDKDGNKTPPSPAGIITNGPSSLSGSNQNTITWTPVDGAVTYDLLRGDTSHSVALGLATAFYQDSASTTSPYTPSATSPNGTLTVDSWVSARNYIIGQAILDHGSTVTPNTLAGGVQKIVVVDSNPFTIANPTSPTSGAMLTLDIKNVSGGAMGTVTWGSAFLLAGAFTNPADGKRRTITFYHDGANWVETGRAGSDI